jgi:formylglycine-generating enzyme required for sulfatase activity
MDKLKSLAMASAILFGCTFFAQTAQAQTTKDVYLSAQKAYKNGDYTTAITQLNKTERLLGATNLSIEYLKALCYYQTHDYEKCVSVADRYFSFKPAQGEDYKRIADIKKQAKEQIRLAAKAQRKKAPLTQEATVEWEKLKTSDSKSALQAFANKYAGTLQEQLAKHRYDTLAKNEAKAKKEKEKVNKINVLLNKYGMALVEGGDYKISKKETIAVKSFYIGKYEVTRDIWNVVMGKDISYLRQSGDDIEPNWVKTLYKRMDLPAEISNRIQIEDFITGLNQLTGKKYRLPTEMEWEYAACGGNKSKGFKYSGGDNPNDVAWYKKNSFYHWKHYTNEYWYDGDYPIIREVGAKLPNELGIYDMSGNVSELCLEGVYKGGDYWDEEKARLLIKSKSQQEKSYGSGIRLVLDVE